MAKESKLSRELRALIKDIDRLIANVKDDTRDIKERIERLRSQEPEEDEA